MKPKDTEKLLELLKKTGSIDAYLQENKDFLLDCNIKEYLRALIREKGITIVQLASDAQLSERYCFQLLSLSNPRHPSRDVLLSMCIGMQLNLDETQTALRIAKLALLYIKRNTLDSVNSHFAHFIYFVNIFKFNKAHNILP